MRRRRLLLAALLAVLPTAVEAQERLCGIDAPGRIEQLVELGDTVIVLYDPFTVTCEDGARLQANSGRVYSRIGEIFLSGDVFFADSTRTLTSGEATYNRTTGRLWAVDDVVFENLEDRSTLEGPELEYFRVTDERPFAEVNATRRPTLTLPPPEDDRDAEPLTLVGDRVRIVGENDLTAFGNVVITRSDFDATAEEAQYDSASEDLELRRNALIVSEEFRLAGDIVQAQLADGTLEHVHARTDAYLEGDDLLVSAPDLQLFFAADVIQRAVATAPTDQAETRARATSRTFELQADSIDAAFIDQRIDEVHAIGSARGETIDTLAATSPALPEADTVGRSGTDIEAPVPSDEPERMADAPIGDLRGAISGDERDGPRPDDTPRDAPRDSVAPTSAPESASVLASDWIVGDTIIGYFVVADSTEDDPDVAAIPGGDTDEPPAVELRRLVARGAAQSLYRMIPEDERDAPTSRRNVNFLVGEEIELELSDGELKIANVTGLQRGIYLEATPPNGDELDEDDSDEAPAATPEATPDADQLIPPILGAR